MTSASKPTSIIISILAIVAIGLAAYSNTFEVPFVFDDMSNIVLNTGVHLHELSLLEFKKVIDSTKGSYEVKKIDAENPSQTTTAPPGRVVSMLSFALNYYFGRFEVFGYHLVNFIIHIAMAICVYFFTRISLTLPSTEKRYGKYAGQVSVATALLFVVHPVQTQSITYLVQRMTSLAALFYMLSLLAYIKARKTDTASPNLYFAISAICALLSFGSKQHTIVLPATIFLYEVYFFQGGDWEFIKKRSWVVGAIILVPVVAAMVYTDLNFIDWILGQFVKKNFTISQRLLTELRVSVYYISLLIFPHPSRLNLDYDFPLSNSLFSPPTTIISLFILIGILYLAYYLYRREPLVSFAIFWFYGNLFLESSFLALDLVYEHRLYLPSVTFFILLSYLIVRAVEWVFGDNSRQVLAKISLLLAVLPVLGIWTYQRNRVWQSNISILEDIVKKSPEKSRQFINLGVAYTKEKAFEKAINAFERSIEIDPKYPEARNNLGNAYSETGRYDKAILEYTEAIRMRPNDVKSYNNLGLAYLKMGDYKRAIEIHRASLQINPLSERTYDNLGLIYFNAGDYENAIASYKRAVQINPYFINPRISLGLAYRAADRPEEALGVFINSLRMFPGDVRLLFNLGLLYEETAQTGQALRAYQEALKRDPRHLPAMNQLGEIYRKSNPHKALEYYRKIIHTAPQGIHVQKVKDIIAEIEGKMKVR